MAFFGGDGVQGKCMEEVSLNPKLGLHPKSSEIRIFGITSLSPQNVEASPMQKITFLYWRTSSNMVSKIPRQKYREARIDDWSTFFFWLRSHIIKQLIFFCMFPFPNFLASILLQDLWFFLMAKNAAWSLDHLRKRMECLRLQQIKDLELDQASLAGCLILGCLRWSELLLRQTAIFWMLDRCACIYATDFLINMHKQKVYASHILYFVYYIGIYRFLGHMYN